MDLHVVKQIRTHTSHLFIFIVWNVVDRYNTGTTCLEYFICRKTISKHLVETKRSR